MLRAPVADGYSVPGDRTAIREQGMEMSETGDQAPAKPARRRPRKKAQMPARAYGRSLSDFEPLLPAERKLLEATARGEVAVIGDKRPEEATKENTVRASFLRFLLLGGDEQAPAHQQGARLSGAWVSGALNLENCTAVSAIHCEECNFVEPLSLRRSSLPGIFMPGSMVKGIEANRANVKNGVFLRDGFVATGTVRIIGAKIDGNLDCRNGQFDGNGEQSIVAARALIEGSVFLRNNFKAIGTTNFVGTQIGNDLVCDSGEFDGNGNEAILASDAFIKGNLLLRNGFKANGTVKILGAHVSGSFVCRNSRLDGNQKNALNARNIRVNHDFIFLDLLSPANKVDLSSASVGALIDDIKAWGTDLVLDGFTYRRIGGGASVDTAERLTWLDKQRPEMNGLSGTGTDFRPQPWKQLQKILREMGHTEAARQVAITFEHRLRKADLIGVLPTYESAITKWSYRRLSRSLHWCHWMLSGYGYRPLRVMYWSIPIWIFCTVFYWYAALPPHNVFAPSNPLIFQYQGYEACRPDGSNALSEEKEQKPVKNTRNWYLCSDLPEEYTGFSPLAYSLDVILPLVDLQQQKDWGPMIQTPKASWWRELLTLSLGHATRLVIWFETLLGWFFGLWLASSISGFVKPRETE